MLFITREDIFYIFLKNIGTFFFPKTVAYFVANVNYIGAICSLFLTLFQTAFRISFIRKQYTAGLTEALVNNSVKATSMAICSFLRGMLELPEAKMRETHKDGMKLSRKIENIATRVGECFFTLFISMARFCR